MNAGIVVAVLVAAVLLYAFYVRISTPSPDPMRLDGSDELLGAIIQVQVLNGSGVNGLAAEMSTYLVSMGFDVVETQTHEDNDVEKTVILDRVGNIDASEQVALAIGLAPDRITENVVVEYYLDATIIIGLDYRDVLPWRTEQEETIEEPETEDEPQQEQ